MPECEPFTTFAISVDLWCFFSLSLCYGFGQDRVNFHWKPGRGTAGWADLTWPNRAGYSIPCAVMLGSGGGELGGGNSLAAQERKAAVRENDFVGCVVCFRLICIVALPVPFVCCSVKLPLSQPTGFCLFLAILLRTPAGGGAAAWRFCCQPQPNRNTLLNFPPHLCKRIKNKGEEKNILGGFICEK